MSRRGPLIAGVAGLAAAVVLVLLLVLPKMNEVSEKETERDGLRTEQGTLESRLRALRSAQEAAPKNQAIIADIDRQIPPTAEVPSVILQMDNAATLATLDLKIFTPATPVFDPTTGLSAISIQMSVQGTYFELDEFLYLLETLPRAAKVVSISISPTAPGSSDLSMQGTVQVFTSDTSAGPGSSPGPTTEAPGTG